MKKIILTVISFALVLAAAGCSAGGNSLENVDTAATVDPSTINQTDYKNDLEGLEQYLTALNYIPQNAAATEMMYNVIGAKDGDRYNFTVDKNAVYVELYEYDPDHLNEEAERVLSEVQKDGKFYVFDDKNLNDNAAYEAELSYNGKYLLIYTYNSTNDNLVQRKKDFTNAVKEFYQ